MRSLKVWGLLAASAVVLVAASVPREGDVRFKVTCQHSHTLADDPIVHPNLPGASHLHDFNGNRSTNAYTISYTSLQGKRTTCNDPQDLAAYWTPQVRVNGQVRPPTSMTGYYRLGGKQGKIQPYPDGLKIVAGHGGGPAGLSGWQCDALRTPKADPSGCRTNLTMVIEFPDCWNGTDIDSADHRSHMAYATNGVCPPSHPVPVPELTTYTHFGDLPAGAVVTLSSGDAVNGVHGDFFNGWVRSRLVERIETCLNLQQKCPSGG